MKIIPRKVLMPRAPVLVIQNSSIFNKALKTVCPSKKMTLHIQTKCSTEEVFVGREEQ
jgi:hypothetical protein